MSVQIRGLNRVKLILDKLQPTMQQKVRDKLHDAMETIRDDAKMNCPVDTGSLKQSIRIFTYPQSQKTFVQIGVRAGGYVTNPKTKRLVDYASHVEYGTSFQQAQPYMRPAWLENKSLVEDILRDAALESLRYLF